MVGISLLVLGFNELNTFGSRTGRMLGARISNETLFLLVGGAACTVFGLIKTFKK
jgi:hypothetical protein